MAASDMNRTEQSRTTDAELQSTRSYKANRISSVADVNGLRMQTHHRNRLDSFTRQSGYSAEDAKNIGKMTKFITPAKFSSWRMQEDSTRPSAPSISPLSTSAGRTAR